MDPLDDIRFWSRQLTEHALFLRLGLEVEPYKSHAKALYDDWRRASETLKSAPTLDAAKSIVNVPTKNLADFKTEVLKQQQGGVWVGWLFPLFVDHMLRELAYFVARVWHGGLPPNQTYCANVDFMQEHAEFAAHLLDPGAVELIEPARAVAGEFKALHEGCFALTPTLIELGRKAGEKLDEYLRTQPISAVHGKSVIHPVLADHVIREGQRFLATMAELNLGSSPASPPVSPDR